MKTIAIEGNGCRPSHMGAAISDEGVMYTLNATEVHIVAYPVEEGIWMDRHLNVGEDDLAPTLCAKYGTGGNNMPFVMDEPMVYDSHPMDSRVTPCMRNCQTLSTRFGGESDPNTILVREMEVFCKSTRAKHPGESSTWKKAEVTNTLNTFDLGESRCNELVVSQHREQGEADMAESSIENKEKQMRYVVRRITPTECERLQGFPNKGDIGPDGKVLERDWTDIPWDKSEHAPDSHRYKALGNSFSVPVVKWIAERIMYALSNPIEKDESEGIVYQQDLFGDF